MQLVTILGMGNYEETTYTWQDQSISTRYVAQAICQIFKPDRIDVFVTADSKAKHWDSLCQQLVRGDINEDHLDCYEIPAGQTEAEIWQIFDGVVDVVEPGGDVIFDITHAFRSIPMLILLAAAFLSKARKVNIAGIYYGAYSLDESPSPIIDLTPATKFLDWLVATDKFVTTGSSVELGQLLTNIQRDFYKRHRREDAEGPKGLRTLGNKIQEISHSIDMVRPIDLLQEAAEIQALEMGSILQEVGIFAKPFELLLDGIKQDYEQFALSQWERQPREVVKIQFSLLQWYVDKEHYVQALLLAREWVITLLCIAQQLDYLNRYSRNKVQRQLGEMCQDPPSYATGIRENVASPANLRGIWRKITSYRNDLAHAQSKRDSKDAERMQQYVKEKLLKQLESNFYSWIC